MKNYNFGKRDALTHVKDHGGQIEFADKKKVAILAEIYGTDRGEFSLDSGKSSLKITRIGSVTLYETMFCGQDRAFLVSLGAGKPVTMLRDNWNMLKSVLLGERLPEWFKAVDGAQTDFIFAWVKSHGWILQGEAGVRAFFAEEGRKKMEGEKSAKLRKINDLERTVVGKRRQVATEFEKQVEFAWIAFGDEKTAEEKRHAIELGRIEAALEGREGGLGELRVQHGALGYQWKADASLEAKGFWQVYLRGTPEKWSHNWIDANYTAQTDGETITLSSGVVCPLKVSDFIKWAKNGFGKLTTRYGAVTLENVRDQEGTPRTLLKNGCHWVAPADLGEEFATLCLPTHKVEKVEKVDDLVWSDDTKEHICNVLRGIELRRHEQSKIDARNRLRAAIARDLEQREYISSGRRDLEVIELEAEIEKNKLEKTELEKQLDEFGNPVGIVMENALRFVTVLTPARKA